MIEIRKIGSAYICLSPIQLKGFFGNAQGDKTIFMQEEALYLAEKGKAEIKEKEKRISIKEIVKRLSERDLAKYIVYKDLREKGYVAKDGTKFGGDFIVYDKGKVPGKDHSTWVCLVLGKEKNIKAKEIVKIMRIVHSTAKNLLLAIIDYKPIYYEVKWKKI
jgi:tRNA-intron endonuclease